MESDQVKQEVAELMADRGYSPEKAIERVARVSGMTPEEVASLSGIAPEDAGDDE